MGNSLSDDSAMFGVRSLLASPLRSALAPVVARGGLAKWDDRMHRGPLTRTRKANLRKRAKKWMVKQEAALVAREEARKATRKAILARQASVDSEAAALRASWESTLTPAQKARNAKIKKEMFIGL